MRLPSPNRLAVYVVAAAALAAALAPVVIDLDFSSVAAILGSLAVIGGVVAKWLTGWQNYEKAIMQRQLIEQQRVAEIEAAQAAVEAQAAVGRPGQRGPKVTLPR